MAARLTVFPQSLTANEDLGFEHIPRRTMSKCRFEDQESYCNHRKQSFHSQKPSAFHCPCGSSTCSECCCSKITTERTMAELKVEVASLRSSLRIQEGCQALASARIAALSFYLEMALHDIEGVTCAYSTEPEQAYLRRCQAAMENALLSRRFLHQMRVESAPENSEVPVGKNPHVQKSNPQNVYRTEFYGHESRALNHHADKLASIRLKNYQAHDRIKLPPIRQVFGDQLGHHTSQLTQKVERQAVSELHPIVDTLQSDLHQAVLADCVVYRQDSFQAPILSRSPSPLDQPHNPRCEPVNVLRGPCSPTYLPISPVCRRSSPEFLASSSSLIHLPPSPIHHGPVKKLSSPFQSPGRTFQPGNLLRRPSNFLNRLTTYPGRGMAIRLASEQLQFQTTFHPPSPQFPIAGGEETSHNEDIMWNYLKRAPTVKHGLQPVPDRSLDCQKNFSHHYRAVASQRIKRESEGPGAEEYNSDMCKRMKCSPRSK